MTRGVHKNYGAIIDHDFVCADVLGDSTSFAGGHFRLANGVQQTCFAVVHVAHDGDHRRTGLETFLGLFFGDFQHHFFFEGNHADDAAKGLGQSGGGGNVQRLVDAGEDSAIQ